MRIGSGDNLALLLIHRHRFDEGRFCVPPPIVVRPTDVVVLNNTVQVAAACDDQPVCSHPTGPLNSTVETDVPRPGGYGYPEIPFNDAAASQSGDSAAAVGGGAGDMGAGNLLDVFA